MTPLNIQKLHTSEAPFGRDLVISYKIETVLFMHHAYRIQEEKQCTYRGADKSLARPTSRCIFFIEYFI